MTKEVLLVNCQSAEEDIEDFDENEEEEQICRQQE